MTADARALDWDEVTARLAAAAESPAGRALCLALPFADDAAEARRRMAAVAEIARLLRAGETLPSVAAPEIDAALGAAEKQIALGAEELRPVAALARAAEAARRYFSGPTPVAIPEMAALARQLDPPLGLARAIDETFDAAGEIRDTASPDLERLRTERKALQERARVAIEELMRAEEYASVMQDQFFTIRAERYVLPLKASAKSLGLGIVHDTSRTGETVFVEPTALVGVNNRLKVTELEIRRESRRILEQLTADVGAVAVPLRRTAATLAAIDARAAAARLGVAYDGNAVEIVDAPLVDLRAARHPLLALSHPAASVIANDVALGGGQPPILIVSGPNAGGKTVLMKSVGLAALMARAGLLVAADARSRVGFFTDVRADIGDRQSVMGDLSTFSGHLAAVGDILKARNAAGSATPASLVLLDELMAGTNPDQGAALARATAETLADRPGLAIITTHYDSLKALGESDARFGNGAMAYDLEALRPTFRLATGAPGRSYAFDIAARMGLPEALLERARSLAGSSSVGLEAVIARLQAREADLIKQTERLAEAETAAAAAEQIQHEAATALARREREIGLKAREAVDAAVAETRAALTQIVRDAQQARSARAAEAGRVEVERVAADALARLPAPAKPPAAATPSLTAGARVFVERMNADGVILEPPDSRGRAKVSVGALTVEVTADELGPPKTTAREAARALGGKSQRGKSQRRAPDDAAGPPSDDLALVAATPRRTVDVRGQNGDEALAAIDAYLDRAALSGETHVVVVHGHGTGALRKRVRAHLDSSPYVARWAPGTPRQGGDGASIIELR
jgi:DNA mismatch repair protein MutS2